MPLNGDLKNKVYDKEATESQSRSPPAKRLRLEEAQRLDDNQIKEKKLQVGKYVRRLATGRIF